MDTTCMTPTDCLGLAQCLRAAILTIAQGERANKHRTSNYSASYDDYIMQNFAQQVQWMQYLFNQSCNPTDMILFREEIAASLSHNYESHQLNIDIITFDEAAKLLHKSVYALTRWRNQGRCPKMFIRIGASWYVDRTKLQAS